MSSAALGQVSVDEPLWRAREPGLGDQLLEVVARYAVQAREHCGIAVEVARREVRARIVGEQRVLCDEVLHARSQARSVGALAADLLDFFRAERALAHE